MALDRQQASDLGHAIETYGFPAVYFDFDENTEIQAGDMRTVENVVRDLLISHALKRIEDGLANVIYWGYAQVGFRNARVRRFRQLVSNNQLEQFRRLMAGNGTISLSAIGALRIPEFSGVSFISKVLAFLDPSHYCVLDKQLLKLAALPGDRALHRVSAGTQIRVTTGNEQAYEAWRSECSDVSARYFNGQYRVVDIERGFFQLVQKGHLGVAQKLYAAV